MGDFKGIVIERGINPYHSFLSSFFAGFAELGMINQASMNIVSKRAAEYLYSYFDAKELLITLKTQDDIRNEESIRYHIDFINSKLNLIGKYDLKKIDREEYLFLIDGNACRICPKGVGGAAIKGTFCPIPSFFKHLVNLLLGKEILQLQSRGIEKEGSLCKAVLMLCDE
jgi:hypothetical protein